MFAQENNENTIISSETTTATITIAGMACQEGCADTIAENLLKITGVASAEVSYKTGEAIVQFDSSLIHINRLKKVITDTKVKDYVYVVKGIILKNKTIE